MNNKNYILVLKRLFPKVSFETFKDIPYNFQSPFSDLVGLSKNSFSVLIKEESPEIVQAQILHELGHLLFDSKMKHEYDWFGWEWTLSKFLNIESLWIESNGDYVVSSMDGCIINKRRSNFCEFGDLSKSQQKILLKERFRVAKKKNLFDDFKFLKEYIQGL